MQTFQMPYSVSDGTSAYTETVNTTNNGLCKLENIFKVELYV